MYISTVVCAGVREMPPILAETYQVACVRRDTRTFRVHLIAFRAFEIIGISSNYRQEINAIFV